MLKRQHRSWREHGDLLPLHDRFERCPHGDFRLPVSDVAAQQTVHRRGRFHVALDVGHCRHLVGGEVVLEGVLELLLPVRIGTEGVAGHGLARSVELEELFRHVAHRLLDPAFGPFPRRAAQPVDGGPRRPRVLLNEVQPFDRHEELVVTGVPQLEKFLERVADADLLEADERPDAMVHVHDQVADLQIAQVRKKRLGGRFSPLGRAPILLEDVGLGVNLQPGVGQPEAARERADGDKHGRVPRFFGAIDRHGEHVVLLQHLDRPFGASRRGRNEERRLSLVAQAANFRDPVGHTPFELHGRL